MNRWKYLCSTYRKKTIQRSGDNAPVNWAYFDDMERSVGVRPKFTRKFVCDSGATMIETSQQTPKKARQTTTAAVDPILNRSNDGLRPLSIADSDGSETTPEKDGGSGDESDSDVLLAIEKSIVEQVGGTRRRFDRLSAAEKQTMVSVAQLNFLKTATRESNQMVQTQLEKQTGSVERAVSCLERLVNHIAGPAPLCSVQPNVEMQQPQMRGPFTPTVHQQPPLPAFISKPQGPVAVARPAHRSFPAPYGRPMQVVSGLSRTNIPAHHDLPPKLFLYATLKVVVTRPLLPFRIPLSLPTAHCIG